jgi:hypothetical protein
MALQETSATLNPIGQIETCPPFFGHFLSSQHDEKQKHEKWVNTIWQVRHCQQSERVVKTPIFFHLCTVPLLKTPILVIVCCVPLLLCPLQFF